MYQFKTRKWYTQVLVFVMASVDRRDWCTQSAFTPYVLGGLCVLGGTAALSSGGEAVETKPSGDEHSSPGWTLHLS